MGVAPLRSAPTGAAASLAPISVRCAGVSVRVGLTAPCSLRTEVGIQAGCAGLQADGCWPCIDRSRRQANRAGLPAGCTALQAHSTGLRAGCTAPWANRTPLQADSSALKAWSEGRRGRLRGRKKDRAPQDPITFPPVLRLTPMPTCRQATSVLPLPSAVSSLAAVRRRPWPLKRTPSPARRDARPWLLPDTFSRP